MTEKRGYWARPYGDFVGQAEDSLKTSEGGAASSIYQMAVTKPLSGSKYLRRID